VVLLNCTQKDKEGAMLEYVLGGQVHLPGESNQFHKSAKTFKITFHNTNSDDEAVKKAKKAIEDERQRAKDGEVVCASLWNGDRMVKNFPGE